MSSNSVSSGLLIAPIQLNIYLGLLIYVTGVLGSIGNIIIYRSRSLRDRACSVYLFWRSVVDFIYMNSILLARILQKGFKIPIMTRYEFLFKIRQFGSSYVNQLAFTFLALATLDRIFLAHRSPGLRRWGNPNGKCEAQPGFYAYFDNIFGAIVTCLFPMVVLTILGILIGRSVHRVAQRRRVVPAVTNGGGTHAEQSAIQKMDVQLTIMLFLDIFVAMISFLPYAVNLIYGNITGNWSKSALQVAWENIIGEIINLLSYTFFSTSFYVSIISLTGFRDQLLRAIRLKKPKIMIHSRTGITTNKTAPIQ
ncbi:hypothetical protein I4U23_010952 [Adineta vaga]|nr:hypothetical protein I4U23_010952 [Adineta vaga]